MQGLVSLFFFRAETHVSSGHPLQLLPSESLYTRVPRMQTTYIGLWYLHIETALGHPKPYVRTRRVPCIEHCQGSPDRNGNCNTSGPANPANRAERTKDSMVLNLFFFTYPFIGSWAGRARVSYCTLCRALECRVYEHVGTGAFSPVYKVLMDRTKVQPEKNGRMSNPCFYTKDPCLEKSLSPKLQLDGRRRGG